MKQLLFLGVFAVALIGPAHAQSWCPNEATAEEILETKKAAYLNFLENGASTLVGGMRIGDQFSAATILTWHHLGPEGLAGDKLAIRRVFTCYEYGNCGLEKVEFERGVIQALVEVASAKDDVLTELFSESPPEAAVTWSRRQLNCAS